MRITLACGAMTFQQKFSRLEAQGWQTCIAHTAPEDGFGLFVYLRPPVTGLLVELVNPAFRPILMAWLAGEASLG